MRTIRKAPPIIKLACMALGLYFIMIACIVVSRPLYLPLLNKSIKIKLTCTGKQNSEALANNVRINHITINGRDINLAAMPLDSKGMWRYDSEDDFLYCYNSTETADISQTFEHVHSLKIGAVREVGAGILEIYLDDRLWKEVDLYAETEWEDAAFEYETSRWVFPEKSIILQMILFVLATGICLLMRYIAKVPSGERIAVILFRSMQAGFLSSVIIFAVGLIQYGTINGLLNALVQSHQSFLKAACVVYLLILEIVFISNQSWTAMLVVGTVAAMGSVISNQKILNRGIPLLPWDIHFLKEAASVVKNYEIVPRALDVCVFFSILILVVLLFAFRKRYRLTRKERIFGSAFLFAVLVLFINTSFLDYRVEANNVDFRVYQVNNYYLQRGFVSAFLEYCTYLNPSEKPENYTRQQMDEIAEKIAGTEDSAAGKTPTIIAIMSESFWDLARLNTITFYQDVIPNYRAVSKEGMSGELYTHVLNGGTVTSEFEFLTGFSGEFFPLDYMVYGNFLDEGFVSAVSILKEQGYQTTALHPFIASNYNRETAYHHFGFDQCLFEDDFDDYSVVRSYISDADLFKKVIDEYESNRQLEKPQFIFSVTMQNHGGYWQDTICEKGVVPFTASVYGEAAKGSISDYAAGLHESDKALKSIIDYFEKAEEDVVVVFFGDHMSDAGPKDDRIFSKSDWNKNDQKYEFETHRVPFFIWSNFDNRREDLGLMEVGELFPTVFEKYQIHANPFWRYLQQVRDVYKAADQKLVIIGEDDYRDKSLMSEEQKEVYDTYRLLQYDYIWGKRYAAELWNLE